MSGLRILAAGPGATVQDAGRLGFMRYGVTPAGPMDGQAHALANALLANPPLAAAVEVPAGGMTLRAEGGPVTLAVVGGAFDIRHEGRPVGPALRLTLAPGERLAIRAGERGAFATLAVAGGVAVAPVMGSRAMHPRTGLGPFGGRALAAGDLLPAGAADLPDLTGLPAPEHPAGPVRAMPGPQAHLFAAGALQALGAAQWTVGLRSDRMAYLLEGPPLAHAGGHDIVSDGVVAGAIQVPGDGLPRVLMADRQTTGGYPKIACIVSADLPRLAQLRPGERLRLALTDRAGAAAARAAARDAAAAWLAAVQAPRLGAERLLSLNLIDGVLDATAV